MSPEDAAALAAAAVLGVPRGALAALAKLLNDSSSDVRLMLYY